MNDPENARANLFAPFALAVVAVGLGTWALAPPISSLRPPPVGSDIHSLVGDQTVEARLWQDPLRVVEEHGMHHAHDDQDKKKKKKESHHDSDDVHSWHFMARQISEKLNKGEDVKLLSVMIAGSSYGEDSESRMRSRRAVVAALSSHHLWRPSDNSHIGYFEIDWPSHRQLGGKVEGKHPSGPLSLLINTNSQEKWSNASEEKLQVPYEWFVPVEPKTNVGNILIWWLRSDAFIDHPLTRMAALQAGLNEELKESMKTGDNPTDSIEHVLLGPRTSSGLLAFLDEALGSEKSHYQLNDKSLTNWMKGTRVLASWPTISERILLEQLEKSPADSLTNLLTQNGFTNVHRLNLSDDTLMKGMAEELELRRLGLTKENTGLVLLSEYDTLYGRSLPREFRQGLSLAQPTNRPLNIIEVGYLRSLDGERFTADAETVRKAQSSQHQERESSDRRLRHAERAEGLEQLDDIRRLSQLLIAHDQSLRRKNGRGIRAVGVLGSDFHDKLVILKALRPAFPQAIFFTTDLDARMLDDLELPHTRNLLVASGYGLSLREDLQGGAPPFRSSYQTAMFHAARVAVSPHVGGFDKITKPLIFEIGQTKAHQFGSNRLSPPDFVAARTPFSWMYILCFGSTLFLLVVIFCFISPLYREWMSSFKQEKLDLRIVVTLVIPSLFSFAAIALLWHSARDPGGEPFYWTEGISVGPTIVIWVGIFWLCLFFALRVDADLLENMKNLQQGFRLPGRLSQADFDDWLEETRSLFEDKPAVRDDYYSLPQGDQARKGALTRWERIRESLRWARPHLLWDLVEKKRSGRDIWCSYNAIGTFRARLVRILVCTILFSVSSVGIILVFGKPLLPIRGDAAHAAYWIALSVSVIFGQLPLIFFVLDATILCRRMILAITHEAIGWPRETYKLFMNRLNIPKDYLNEWIDIQVIARRSDVIMPLVYFPFLTITLMIASRNPVFEGWTWPAALMIIAALSIGLMVFATVLLRRAAEEARKRSLENLRHRRLRLMADETIQATVGGGSKQDIDADRLCKQIDELIADIENNNTGAFAPLAEQPILKALLLPFGGAGFLALMEFLTFF